jgi:hypothetical protein
MGFSGETHSISTRRHLNQLVGAVALQIAQLLLAHDSVVDRVLYDAAFGVVLLLVSFAIFLQALGEMARARADLPCDRV